jgi:hypothetical protein
VRLVTRRTTPATVVAVATVLIVLAAMVTFSVYGNGHAGGCANDAANLRRALTAYRAQHGADAVPTMSELVAGGVLLQASVLHDVSYAGSPPSLRLTPRPGSGC